MITYGFSVQGKSHIKRGVVCQDYSMHVKIKGEWYLGIVADGVGSAPHSDIGSRMAAESLCDFCQKNVTPQMSEQQLEELLYHGYEYALKTIVQYVGEKNDALDAYDTTLSAALFNGERVIYGHAGDGGILVRLWDGRIKPITERQKGADGSSVRPLRAGEQSWDFGVCREKAAAVLLVTDGMLDGVFQPVLLNLPSDTAALARGNFSKDNAYITASEFFMNPYSVYLNKQIANADEFMRKYIVGDLGVREQDEFLKCMVKGYTNLLGKESAAEVSRRISEYHYAVWALKEVTDDKSVVCLINERAIVIPQDITYYYEPDWKRNQECYSALLYGRPMPPESKPEPKTEIRDDFRPYVNSDNDYLEDERKPKTETRLAHIMQAGKRSKLFMTIALAVIVFLLGGVVGTGLMFLSHKPNNKVAGVAPTSEPTLKPTSKPDGIGSGNGKNKTETADPSKGDEEELDEEEKKEIQENAKKIVEILAEDIDWKGQDLSELRGKMEENELGDKLKQVVNKKQKNKPSTSQLPSSASSQPTPTVTPPRESASGQSSSYKDVEKVDKLNKCIASIKGKKETNVFKNNFKNEYEKLEEGQREKVRNNLNIILNSTDSSEEKEYKYGQQAPA